MPAPERSTRVWRGRLLRVLVSAVVLAVVFSFLPLPNVLATIRRIGAADWLATFAVFLAGHTVAAAKWQLLVGSEAGFAAVLRAHFAGLAANLWLPGLASGDLVRAAVLYRRVSDKARLAVGSVADRIVDSVGLLLLAGGGLLVSLRQVPSGRNLLVGLGLALLALVAGLALTPWIYPRVLKRLPAGGTLRGVGEQVASGVDVLARRPLRLVLCLVLSMAVQSAFVLANLILARATGVHAPLAAWFFAWPLSKIVAMLPISLGGIGVREASLAGFLAPFGAESTAVVATGLLWQTVLLAGGLAGAATTMLISGRARHAAPGPPNAPPGATNGAPGLQTGRHPRG